MISNLKFQTSNVITLLLLVTALSLSGCGRKGNPVIPGSIAPETVSGLTARPTPGKVSLAWSMPTKTTEGKRLLNLEMFIVQRGEVPEGTKPDDCACAYKTVATIDVEAPQPARITEGKVLFDDVKVNNDQTYAYRVIAVNKYDRESKPAGPVVARPSVPPAAPSNLAAEADDKQIRLTWDAPKRNEDGTPLTDLKGYNVYRSTQQGVPVAQANQELVSGTSFTDIGLPTGKTFYYMVKAVDNLSAPWSESRPSNEVSAATEDRTSPRPPVNVVAVPGPKEIRLNWEPNQEGDLAGYRIYRSTTPGQGYEPVTAAPVKTNSFTDTDVMPGVAYYYVVTSVDNAPRANESFRSEQVTVELK